MNGKHKTIAALLIIIVLSLLAMKAIRPPTTGESISAHVQILGAVYEYNCTLSLEKGWNLISEPCIFSNNSIQDVLNAISGNYSSIHYYDAELDEWHAYNPSLPSWVVQELSEINPQLAYWINATAKTSAAMNGTVMTYQISRLKKGWNMIGISINGTKNASEAFYLSEGSILKIVAYNSTTNSYETYVPGNTNNSLAYITAGRGYWVNVSSDADWRLIE